MHPLEINFVGMLRAPTSRAHVIREMILALDARGHDMSITNCHGFHHDDNFPLPPRLVSLMDKPRHSRLDVAVEYPPDYCKLEGQRRVGMLVYETTVLPPLWRDAVLEYLDMLIVPNEFSRETMLSAGIPAGMIEIVPYGVRPDLFMPDPEPDPGEGPEDDLLFKFLCIAVPHKRKALDILLDAYCGEFSDDDNVCLIIKSSYQADTAKMRPWEINLESMLQDFSSRPGAPEILHLSEPWPIEALPALYTACDCYVQPSRSEGFGLGILEAFACARPAIVTGWGGHMDFCDESNSFIIDHSLVPAGDIQYDSDSPDALIALPDTAHLRSLMRAAFEDPAALRRKAKAALTRSMDYTWAAAAEKMETALLKLMEES